MIHCPVCKREEYEGTLFCSECGAPLWQGAPHSEADEEDAAGTLRFRSDKLRAGVTAALDAGQRPITPPRQIAVRVQGAADAIVLGDRNEYRVGRGDPGQEARPDLDLNSYRGQELGVSRNHAVLRRDGPYLTLTDLGSTNGTQVNGVRLPANLPTQLRDGDELRLGKLVLRIFFQHES